MDERQTSGGATDGAILKYAANAIEEDWVREDFSEIGRVPFNSKNKWMAVVFRNREKSENKIDCFDFSGDKCVITVKG